MTNSKQSMEEMEFPIRGICYEGRAKYAALLTEGEAVLLVPEPENPYDHNAIAILNRSGQQLGYVPRESAVYVGSVLQKAGASARAVVDEVYLGQVPVVYISLQYPEEGNMDADSAGQQESRSCINHERRVCNAREAGTESSNLPAKQEVEQSQTSQHDTGCGYLFFLLMGLFALIVNPWGTILFVLIFVTLIFLITALGSKS